MSIFAFVSSIDLSGKFMELVDKENGVGGGGITKPF